MSEKTEQPTSKKLRDAREKGEVASSKEIPSVLLIVLFFGLLAAQLPGIVERMQRLILLPPQFLEADLQDATGRLLHAYAGEAAGIVGPFLLVAIVGTIIGTVGQFGLLLAFQSATPSFKKLNPASYFKKTFGLDNLIDLLKSLFKIVFLGLVIYRVIRDGLPAMVTAPTCGLQCLRSVMGEMLWTIAIWCTAPFVIVAAADFAYQKYSFTKKNMMSKDEVKREYKESEGDPQVKGMRKQLHHQMMAEGNVEKARKATVVIANPTHIAVAVYYEREETPLPVITAMATGGIAVRMIEAAAKAGVPVMRNVPLAHALLEGATVDQYLPSDLIEPFAEVSGR